MSRNYISHYGVPGMKWRFTKYTNKIRKGGKNIYEYFTKKKVTKGDIRRSQKQLQGLPTRRFKGTGQPGYFGFTGQSTSVTGRTQFQRDLNKAARGFRKATKPLRKSLKKYYKNTLSPAMRRFKTAAPVKLQSLKYRLGGIKGKLISRLKGYTGGGGPSNIRSLDARTVKNARMTDYSNAKLRNYDKTHQNSTKSVGYVATKGPVKYTKDKNGRITGSSQSTTVKPIYKTQYGDKAKNPYWGYGSKKKKSSQSDYSKHYKYKRNRGAGNPYWGRK